MATSPQQVGVGELAFLADGVHGLRGGCARRTRREIESFKQAYRLRNRKRTSTGQRPRGSHRRDTRPPGIGLLPLQCNGRRPTGRRTGAGWSRQRWRRLSLGGERGVVLGVLGLQAPVEAAGVMGVVVEHDDLHRSWRRAAQRWGGQVALQACRDRGPGRDDQQGLGQPGIARREDLVDGLASSPPPLVAGGPSSTLRLMPAWLVCITPFLEWVVSLFE